MQARSAASRWGGLSPAERSAKMKALRAKAKRKPKRAARLPNSEVSGGEPLTHDKTKAATRHPLK